MLQNARKSLFGKRFRELVKFPGLQKRKLLLSKNSYLTGNVIMFYYEDLMLKFFNLPVPLMLLGSGNEN